MPLVKNITTDDLHFQGLEIPAGQTVEVSPDTAGRMTLGHPQKFKTINSTGSSETAAAESPSRHRHHYSASGFCSCGRKKA